MKETENQKIYLLVRSATFEVDEDYSNVEYYSNLESAKAALKVLFAVDNNEYNSSEKVVKAELNELSYYVEVTNKNQLIGGFKVSAEILTKELL